MAASEWTTHSNAKFDVTLNISFFRMWCFRIFNLLIFLWSKLRFYIFRANCGEGDEIYERWEYSVCNYPPRKKCQKNLHIGSREWKLIHLTRVSWCFYNNRVVLFCLYFIYLYFGTCILFVGIIESAKSRTWCACVLCVLTCLVCLRVCMLVMMKCFIFLRVCVLCVYTLGVFFCLISFTFQ